MAQSTVRIGEDAMEALRRLAAQEGRPMRATLARAIETYRRVRFLEDVNAGYAALRRDRRAWRHEEEDRGIWDGTLADGLEARPSAGRPTGPRGKRHGGKR